jgi:diguanylate cyclase (GGDEF)-like protein
MLTADHASRIHASLEPPHIAQAFELVCAELVGPCEVRIFTYLADDHAHVVRFGPEEDESKVLTAPDVGQTGKFGISVRAVEEEPLRAVGSWRALLPISIDQEAMGVLEVSCEKPKDAAEMERLAELNRVLGIALRNAQTFERTKKLTFTDDLTALYNSRFMALYLDRELKRCRRMRSSLSLLFMDLDGFKNVNDTHGHLAGSRTLVEVGAVLEKTVRDADVLIRYGGDEFVILFPETPLQGGLIIAERIRQVIESTKFLESMQIEARVSASIGIAAYPESADDVRTLISGADQAMYAAKSRGKNRVVAAPPLSHPDSIKRS